MYGLIEKIGMNTPAKEKTIIKEGMSVLVNKKDD